MTTNIRGIVACISAIALIVSCDRTERREIAVIPEPLSARTSDGTLTLKDNIYISFNDTLLKPLSEYVASSLGRMGIDASTESGGTPLNLRLTASHRPEGSYTVEINSKSITIAAPSYEGIVNGVATILQMIPTDSSRTLRTAVINDTPRMRWRGLMLDCARHFFTVEEVEELLDVMALYKLNKFHWHLTDDQGWRIEIKRYPLLTKRGAWRRFNGHDREGMRLARVQDNDDLLIPESKLRINGTDTLYGGFYTQDDIRRVVRYAAVRGIDIIPEIDMPGHMLTAMENYKGISCFDNIGWGETFSSPLCPGKESTLEFARNVYAEIFDLFPYEYVHIGADEVEKNNWERCPDCRRRMRENGLEDTEQLQAWFVGEMEEFFDANGKKLIGWDEITDDELPGRATVAWWRSWARNAVNKALSNGNDVIICPNEVFYFDYGQNETTLKKLYEYEIIDPSTELDLRDRIIGAQANTWCEWIPSRERLYYMIAPRIMALSELCWSDPSNKDWKRFSHKVTRHLPLLESRDIPYRPLDITAVADYGAHNTEPQPLQASYAYTSPIDILFVSPTPGSTVRYTVDGTTPSVTSQAADSPVKVTETTDFSLRIFTANGKGGETVASRVTIAPCSPADTDARPTGLGLEAVWHDYAGDICSGIEEAPVRGTFKTSKVTIPPGVKGNIGLVFTGYIDVPRDHVYTFALNSDDGSQLWIDGSLTVDNDGEHAPRTVTGQKALAKGLHPVKIYYFDHNGGTVSLSLVENGHETIIDGEMWKM